MSVSIEKHAPLKLQFSIKAEILDAAFHLSLIANETGLTFLLISATRNERLFASCFSGCLIFPNELF